MEKFYSAPICSPTRAACMMNRDPPELGIASDQTHPSYNGGLAPSSETIRYQTPAI